MAHWTNKAHSSAADSNVQGSALEDGREEKDDHDGADSLFQSSIRFGPGVPPFSLGMVMKMAMMEMQKS